MARAGDIEAAAIPAEHESLWIEEEPGTTAPVLREDKTVDTAVVGGGICGITAAANLVEAGRSVALLEAGRIVQGVTGHTTAKLTAQHGLIYDHLVSTFGEEKAQQYADANQAAIEAVADRVGRHGIECNFRRASAYTYVRDEGRVDEVRREVDAARSLGLPASFVEDPPLPFDVAAAVRFDDQAYFHPRRYLLALTERVDEGQSVVHERTPALELEDGDPCTIEAESHTVTADEVVVATHFPVFDRAGYFARMRPKKSYVLATRLEGDQPLGMHYRDADPIFSIRPRAGRDEDLVLFTGQNHRTGDADEAERYRRLKQQVRQRFAVAAIEYRWSTQDFVSFDQVPFVGKLGPGSENVYTATGFGGWGMTNGVAAGRIIADAVLGRDPDNMDVFSTSRLRGTSPRSFLAHNVHAAKAFVADRVRRLAKPRGIELAEGEGKVVKVDGEPVAAHRDDDGELHTLSAIGTHMGCEVKWNDGDETWDCPCHGSRFDSEGNVVDGPAIEGLEPKRV
jgi:glycine/D-amino acid oxidase-like deaminating enzyme/nitrite reductase/ring-hydroxylating ferredoxin subunit